MSEIDYTLYSQLTITSGDPILRTNPTQNYVAQHNVIIDIRKLSGFSMESFEPSSGSPFYFSSDFVYHVNIIYAYTQGGEKIQLAHSLTFYPRPINSSQASNFLDEKLDAFVSMTNHFGAILTHHRSFG